MKKFVLLLALCLLCVIPATAQATPVDELTALATFFPEDTAVFGVIRSDDEFLESLNTLLERIQRRIDSPVVTIQDTIDQVLIYSELNFADDIRPWLGDSIAFGLRDIGSRFGPTLVVAIAVTDFEPVAALLEVNAEDISTGEEYTQYSYSGTVARLYGNALLISGQEDMLDAIGEGARLSDSADFTETLDLLPEDEYNAVVYVQTGVIMDALQEQMENSSNAAPAATMMLFNQFSVGGSQAIGFTILNGLGYAIDFASHPVDDVDPAYAAPTDSPPLDYDFASHVPANASLYIQDTNFGTDVSRAINLLSFILEAGIDQQLELDTRMDEDSRAFLDSIDRNDVRAFINLSFAGFTGLNFENDVLANLNGNVGMFLGFIENDELGVIPDGAFIAEMDGDASERIFNSVEDALTQYEADFSVDGNVITLPQPLRFLMRNSVEPELLDNPAFDLQLGYSDEVFAVGTRSAVQFSLDPGEATLAETPAYNDAQDYFLPDAETLYYANLAPLIMFIDDELDPRSSQYGNDGLKILSLFTSASITMRVDDDGSSVGRAVLVLREEN